METDDISISSGLDSCEVLLIGDLSRAFSDIEAAMNLSCEVYANMLDGIEAASEKDFGVIGVVVSGVTSSLDSALESLREASSGAKIFLLVQMHEEPLAMQLVGLGYDGGALVDDYLICPIEVERFCKFITGSPSEKKSIPAQIRQQVSTITPAVSDRDAEMKIEQLEKLATEDELTGLKNRRYMWEFSKQIIERARKENGQVTLLMFDIDNFKHYNDVYGHSAGDKILKQAAILMKRCCRDHDVVGRIGGDEFVVIFWDDPRRKSVEEETERRSAAAEHPKEAIFIAKRFRGELNKTEFHLLGPGGDGVLTISGGLASFPRDGSTMEELLQQADEALLEAKHSGKNRIYLVGMPERDISDVE